MKEKQLFYLGFTIMILGFTWLYTMSKCARYYTQYINKDYIMGILIITAILMAVGGFTMMMAYFSD